MAEETSQCKFSTAVNVGHLLVVAPIFGYLGWKLNKAKSSTEPASALFPAWIGFALIILAVMIVLYHTYRIFTKLKSKTGELEAAEEDAAASVAKSLTA